MVVVSWGNVSGGMSGRDWGLRRGCGEERRCGVGGRGRYARAGRTMGEVPDGRFSVRDGGAEVVSRGLRAGIWWVL